MFDVRSPLYVIGLLTVALGAAMILPMLADILTGSVYWKVFGISSIITCLVGGLLSLACANADRSTLTIQQAFLLTTGVWVVLPLFGGLPFMLGETEARFVDAFFEAMSGLTTTGSTVFVGLDDLSRGILLWRGILQWIGGVGIIVFAMVFLPVLGVGGMQMFRTEAFDTMGKVLPRAAEIARSISYIYVGLTIACMVSYSLAGMNFFDALVHSMTTVATGGFGNYDNSFATMSVAVEYVAVTFMILACLPFVRYVQLAGGSLMPLLRDSQVRGFLITCVAIVILLTGWQVLFVTGDFEPAFRKASFNGISILTGAGFTSDDYNRWGSFSVTLFFLAGLIGGCAGSTTCAIKIFRFQLLFASIKTQVKRIHSPSGVFQPRYEGRAIGANVISSVMSYLVMFIISLAVLSVALGMTGLDTITSISGAATALANVGPGLGPEIGPSGSFANLNDTAKWMLSAGMLVGRLELMTVYVLFTASFWRG